MRTSGAATTATGCTTRSSGNYILDAFTTEIGAEVLPPLQRPDRDARRTGGEVHGAGDGAAVALDERVLASSASTSRSTQDLRVRLTGSFYADNKATSNTLFTGDRGGSPYYDVLENTASTETANAWSGEIRPGFSNKVNAEVINPFIKIGGAEFFGNFETATGGAFTEPKLRTIHQNVYEGLYRLVNDKFYVGGRYNTLTAR